MEKPTQAERLDWYEDVLTEATQAASKTSEGFLKARAVVTTIGVFSYPNPDGTTRRELRLPEEVFSEESLETLKMKPLTLLHPSPDNPVTPENAGGLEVGHLGDGIYNDSYRVYAPIMVTHREAIDGVTSGEVRGLSCGYNCDIEWKGGTWFGQQYDCIQRNIRYNHVALVPKGRAGDDAVIRLDSAGTPGELPKELNIINKEPNMDLKTIRMDGVDYQAEAQVITALTQANEKVEGLTQQIEKLTQDSAELNTKASALEGERDSLKERLDAAEKELPSRIQSAVAERIELMEKAKAAGVECHADSEPSSVKSAVILKKFPSANLEGRDESYINARFDAACELIAQEAENKSRQDASDVPPPAVEDKGESELDKAMSRFNARMDSAWKDEPQTKEA